MFNSKRIQELEDELESMQIWKMNVEKRMTEFEGILFKTVASLQSLQNIILGRRKKK